MIILSLNLNFVTQNVILFREGKRDQANKMIVDFLSLLRGEVDGFYGFLVMNSLVNNQSVVLTFWETEASMNTFYHHKNAILNDFAERLIPLIENSNLIQHYHIEIADLIPGRMSFLIQ